MRKKRNSNIKVKIFINLRNNYQKLKYKKMKYSHKKKLIIKKRKNKILGLIFYGLRNNHQKLKQNHKKHYNMILFNK